ncbi:MAG: DUF3078 domain-containing protein [Ignavibacteriales bacterium]|nr:DUF3078 domain-containing protein [Ignavibacteriales bacterium]
MKRLFGFVLLFISCAAGQPAIIVPSPPPTDSLPTQGPWKHAVVAGITMTQIAFKDWAQGGENALSYAINLNGKSNRDDDATNWSNSYRLGFGQTRLGSQGLRKTDDKIDLESVLSFIINAPIDPYASLTLKTQFASGYTYDQKTGTRTPVSKFFDPAYLTQTAGFRYKPLPQIKTRLGAGVREVITSVYRVYADDPKTTQIEKIKVDGGFESVTNIDFELDENLVFAGRLELFSAFRALDEVIVRSDNSITAKVGKFVSVILNIQIINDTRATARTQLKETLSLGFIYTLI